MTQLRFRDASERKHPDMFVEPQDDPREDGTRLGDERATLMKYLRGQRLTLEMKCFGLNPEQLARRAVEPSPMSLLGLVRHMAEVERSWMQWRMANNDISRPFSTEADPDADFNGAIGQQSIVDEAWAMWNESTAFTDNFVAQAKDLGVTDPNPTDPISLREVLVHLIEEYARHNGHADLLRERIDGRTGE